MTGDDDEMFMAWSLNVTPKTTEQHLIARSDKSVAYVTNNKRLRSTFCTIEANHWQTRSIARPLCDSWATCPFNKTSRKSRWRKSLRHVFFALTASPQVPSSCRWNCGAVRCTTLRNPCVMSETTRKSQKYICAAKNASRRLVHRGFCVVCMNEKLYTVVRFYGIRWQA